MDNIGSVMKNRSSISTGVSKIYLRDSVFGQNEPRYEQKLNHQNCECYHCINNTKPINQPIYNRIKSQHQYQKSHNQAYTFIIQNLVDYIGNLKIPDTYIANNSSLINVSNKKIKIKSNLPLSEIKKYFDARKILYNKILKNQYYCSINKLFKNASKLFIPNTQSKLIKKQNLVQQQSIKNQNITSESMRLSLNESAKHYQINNQIAKKQKQIKQVGIINYSNNFSQLVTQSSLNKYLSKRKNDPFWQQISSISLIPPYKQQQLTYHKFMYLRTQQNLKQMQQQMQRVANIIDQQDKYNDISSQTVKYNPQYQFTDDKYQNNKTVKSHQNSQISQQNSPKNNQDLSGSINKNTSLQNYKSTSPNHNSPLININNTQYVTQTISKLSKQVVAYLEVKLHIRISSCLFKYIIDYQNNYYLAGVQKFIAHNLKPNQLKIIHDRYTSLQLHDQDQIAQLKILSQQVKQYKALQNELAQLVGDCLQKRKHELQQVQYKRPCNQNLVRIFKRIFVNFNEQQVLSNKNWRNQFPVYINNCRKTINKIIRQDQGIRILKRFGISFYRTWN